MRLGAAQHRASRLGLWVSAAIPFAYRLATAVSLYTFARTRRYQLFRRSQLLMTTYLLIGRRS